jgi:hypothetical protein
MLPDVVFSDDPSVLAAAMPNPEGKGFEEMGGFSLNNLPPSQYDDVDPSDLDDDEPPWEGDPDDEEQDGQEAEDAKSSRRKGSGRFNPDEQDPYDQDFNPQRKQPPSPNFDL